MGCLPVSDAEPLVTAKSIRTMQAQAAAKGVQFSAFGDRAFNIIAAIEIQAIIHAAYAWRLRKTVKRSENMD